MLPESCSVVVDKPDSDLHEHPGFVCNNKVDSNGEKLPDGWVEVTFRRLVDVDGETVGMNLKELFQEQNLHINGC